MPVSISHVCYTVGFIKLIILSSFCIFRKLDAVVISCDFSINEYLMMMMSFISERISEYMGEFRSTLARFSSIQNSYVDKFRFRWVGLRSHGRDMVLLHRCSISNASMLCDGRD